MTPITLLLGKSVDPWIQQSLIGGCRCAIVTENPTPLREKFPGHAADWRLIPLCADEDATFRRLLASARVNTGLSETVTLFEAATAYIGVPRSLIVCDTGDATEEVVKFIFSRHMHGISRITFPGISDEVLSSLRRLNFNKLSMLINPHTKVEDTPPSAIRFPSSPRDIADLFRAEYFRAER